MPPHVLMKWLIVLEYRLDIEAKFDLQIDLSMKGQMVFDSK